MARSERYCRLLLSLDESSHSGVRLYLLRAAQSLIPATHPFFGFLKLRSPREVGLGISVSSLYHLLQYRVTDIVEARPVLDFASSFADLTAV
jgi:hypothetical protein